MAARFHALISDFCFGETSPRVRSRLSGGNIFGVSPAEVNRSGCREVTNNIILPQGGAYRREGFRFKRDTTLDVPSGVAEGSSFRQFTLTTDLADVILLLTPGELWLYQLPQFNVVNHAVTPYTATDLRNIGVTQWERNAVIFSAGHRPRLLKWDVDFSFTDPGADFIAPLYPYHDSRSPLPQTGSWKLDIPEATFSPGVTTSAGFAVSGISSSAQAYISLDGGMTASNIQDNLNHYNTAVVPGTAVVTYDGTTGTIMHYTVDYQFKSTVGDASGTLLSPFTQTRLIDGQSGAEPLWSGPLLVLHGANYYECLRGHISAAADEPAVGGNSGSYWVDRGTTVPTDKDYDVASGQWALETSYSARNRGWPPQMTFHEQRLAGSGPQGALSVIAASRIVSNPDLFDFTLGPNAADGLLFRLTGRDNCVVRWLLSSSALYIGTSAGVFVQTAQPWTPTNVAFDRINGYPASLTLRAIEVEGEVFFPTVDDRQIRQIAFSNDLQSWQSFDLTAFAEHMFSYQRRLKQVVSHQGTDTLVWAIRTDGSLLGMTYSPAHHTLAWHKHSVADPVLQIGSAFDGEKTITVALIFRRFYSNTSGWQSRAFFEVLEHTSRNLFELEPAMFRENNIEPLEWLIRIARPHEWSVHLDSWASVAVTLPLQLPARFAGRQVGIVADGEYLGAFTIAAGGLLDNATLNAVTATALSVVAGFEYPARLEPNRFEAPVPMTSQSQKVRWVKPVMRLLTSVMPLLNGYRANERMQDALYDRSTGLLTGDVAMSNVGSDGRIVIEADLPLPCHLTGIFGLMTTEEG